MNYFCLITILLCTVVGLVCSVARRKKHENIQSFHQRTGEPIAVDNLLWKYEKQHQKLYNEGIKDGAILQWPGLDDKSLSAYCMKYLQHTVPARTTDNVVGTAKVKKLHYEKENTSIISKIIVVQCSLYSNNIRRRSYYVTRNAKSNCVYALKNTKYEKLYSKFTIINEHCDFKDKPYRTIKRKKLDIVDKTHRTTGQPIAKVEYLLEYEMEHNKLLNKEGQGGKYIRWSHAVLHSNLNSYCNHYMRVCVPNRNREDITGCWNIEKLHYQKFNSNEDIRVIIVSCVGKKWPRLHYHITRAPETNCVYALLRAGKRTRGPLVIVFKHCDFEGTKETILEEKSIYDRNVSKHEIKEETHETLKTQQLFSKE